MHERDISNDLRWNVNRPIECGHKPSYLMAKSKISKSDIDNEGQGGEGKLHLLHSTRNV